MKWRVGRQYGMTSLTSEYRSDWSKARLHQYSHSDTLTQISQSPHKHQSMSLGEANAKFPGQHAAGLPPSPSRENPGQVFPHSDPKAAPRGSVPGTGEEREPYTTEALGNPRGNRVDTDEPGVVNQKEGGLFVD
ncbi:hypothetical protein C8Q74DRAFT_1301705 [Fomes fomentarius]|nr:hypothetical protein C8Q74DRAFT_1301705 [Fomes fomentarius]